VRFTAGQVPVRPLRIVVLDERGRVVDLGTYSSVELVLRNPDGVLVDTSAGALTVDDEGAAVFTWPTVTLFPTPGDYRLTLKAHQGSAVDWTDDVFVEVYREGA
jgi:hypothetical protein